LHLLRALVEEGPNDLFLAEDSQQRIYGQRVVLSRYDINVRGRSRRLTLNYRTTAQNLRFAVGVLAGADFVDMEDSPADIAGYRSSRLGPSPREAGYDSLADAYGGAAKVLQQWIASGDKPETLGVLVRTRNEAEKVVHALSEYDLQARFVEE